MYSFLYKIAREYTRGTKNTNHISIVYTCFYKTNNIVSSQNREVIETIAGRYDMNNRLIKNN